MERLVISTGPVVAGDQFEAFRETFGRSILNIDIERLPGRSVESEMVLQRFPGVSIASGQMSHAHTRHRAQFADNDDLVLVFMESGHGMLDQHGHRTTLLEGSVAVTANGEPAVLTLPSRTRLLNLRLERQRLFPKLANIGDLFDRPVLRHGPELHLLKGYLAMVAGGAQSSAPALSHSIATHLYDLAALAIGATQDASALAKRGGVRAARLAAIKSDIVALLDRQDLSIDVIARKHAISPGYMRKLFADEGTSFRDFVLEQRLQFACRMLTTPSVHSISQIAFNCGFGDLSYFNRSFRLRYGTRPSDIRKATWNTSRSGG